MTVKQKSYTWFADCKMTEEEARALSKFLTKIADWQFIKYAGSQAEAAAMVSATAELRDTLAYELRHT